MGEANGNIELKFSEPIKKLITKNDQMHLLHRIQYTLFATPKTMKKPVKTCEKQRNLKITTYKQAASISFKEEKDYSESPKAIQVQPLNHVNEVSEIQWSNSIPL